MKSNSEPTKSIFSMVKFIRIFLFYQPFQIYNLMLVKAFLFPETLLPGA
jgi:hypothetical protein